MSDVVYLKIYDAIVINVKYGFTHYISNDSEFKGEIKVPTDKVSNFEEALKRGVITVEKWEARLIKKD